MSSKPRILYISSASPTKGPGSYAWITVKQMKEAGYDIDLLTLYKEPSLPDVLYVKKRNTIDRIIARVKTILYGSLPGRPHYFFYKKESSPPIPVHTVLSRITKEYDLVIIYFWQKMLSFKTVEAIYDKLNKPVVFFFSPDYSHMSGGCHFTCDCNLYKTGCGKCPAINSNNENDFTRWNTVFRKRFYEKVKPVVFGNSYMNMFYSKSFLLHDARVVAASLNFDVVRYKPIDKKQSRAKFGIEENTFVIAFGCQQLSDPRKGIVYLIEALTIVEAKMSENEKSKVVLLVAGDDYQQIKDSLPFASIGTGLLPVARLPEFYSSANIFVCSSVDDAGPSMVAQSIACGVPVVGFKMGAMLDVVLDKGTGYCAELKNSEELAEGILMYYRMKEYDYLEVSEHCRQFALDNSSFESKVNRWMDFYEKYKVR